MFGLFGKSRYLDEDVEDWCLESWAWLMRNLGGVERLKRTAFVVPTREFFPPTETEGHERAVYIFELVKRHMGMSTWPCELEPHDRPAGSQVVAQIAAVQVGPSPSGTFRVEQSRVVVSYAEDLLDRPRDLIATLAHELAHYLLATIKEPIPGGEEVHELTTELAVAYAGFGVLGANHAFSFEQHGDAFSQGWSSQRRGYFSERTWAFAIAVFASLKGVDVPLERLKPNIADLTKRADRYLKRNPALIAPLEAIA